MKRCVVLWDLESVPFYYQTLVKKYIVNMDFNYYLDPKFLAVSKKNIHLMNRLKKKRGFEFHVTEDTTKDGADRLMRTLAKQFTDREVVLISNDIKLAKELNKKKTVTMFYINKDIPASNLPFVTVHVFDNFNWN